MVAGMKDFIAIANTNAITYKEFFPLLKDRIVNMGIEKPKEYDIPNGAVKSVYARWFTTLHTPDKKKLILTKKYNENDYPHYDNYNAIEVRRVKDIPYDYNGVMGVPITIFEYDLDNVEILKCLNDNTPDTRVATIEGKEKYARILIRKK